MKYKNALLSFAPVLFVVLCLFSGSCVYSQTDPQPSPPPDPKAGTVVKNSIGMELVWVPPGEFMIGSESGEDDEKPVRRVNIAKGFWMGKYEVTQGQWVKVMGTTLQQQREKAGKTEALNGEGPDHPMYFVSWDDAREFVAKLNESNDGFVYSLPTEPQWEYAARAGATGDHYGSLDEIAWYANNSGRAYMDADRIWRTDPQNFHRRVIQNGGQTHPVGTKKPNDFGLYDLIGNVWEWCEDLYYPNYEVIPALDGSSKITGESKLRVMRGGSFGLTSTNNRAPRRARNVPSRRFHNSGFRIVGTRSLPTRIPQTSKETLKSGIDPAILRF